MRRIAGWAGFPYVVAATLTGLALAAAGYRIGWSNLWLRPDQRGRLLLQWLRPADAADAFRDPVWRGVALFRAGDFKAAAQAFGGTDTGVGNYDQGNALVMLGQYDDAVKRYDRALALLPGWPDAMANREIARVRGERKKAEGGVTGASEKPDDVVFDKSKKGGAETNVQGDKPMSDEAVRALWLKRVQTRPADFLRVKFAYQIRAAADPAGAGSEARRP